jgi:redox-sensitive bicupin YhaK (pirin superfamily)
MGNGRIIKPGEFQYMAAGKGVVHSEYNPSPRSPVHFLQIWIQPDTRGVKPRYGEKRLTESATGQWHLVASKTGRDGSLEIHQDADLWFARLNGGESVTHQLKPDRHAWVHVAEGNVELNGRELRAGDGAALSEEAAVELRGRDGAQVLLFDLN